MTRCRVSEEDARDSHLDGVEDETLDAKWEANKRRDVFRELLEDLNTAAAKLYRKRTWSPDDDDIDLLLSLCDELGDTTSTAPISETEALEVNSDDWYPINRYFSRSNN
jgi:hypothetical protein